MYATMKDRTEPVSSCRLPLYMSRAMRADLERVSDRYGVTVSEYVRRVLADSLRAERLVLCR